MSDNPYTARNSMAVMIDLDKRTIKQVKDVPYSDGHSVAIEYHDGKVYFSFFVGQGYSLNFCPSRVGGVWTRGALPMNSSQS